ncbi:MAG: YegP family protein [Methanomassiliicoccaceae archaeon]|nr:YegP family protein [Methanomassiliicoccaceae archaeon]
MGKSTFIITKTDNGRFLFRLEAANKMMICRSQVYESLAACKAGIESIKKNCGTTTTEDQTLQKWETQKNPKWEVYLDKAGEYRFRLKASNGQNILGSDHGYKSKSGCMGGIKSIANNSPDADVVEEK